MKKHAHKTRRQLQAEKEKLAQRLVDKANSSTDPLADLERFHEYRTKDGFIAQVSCTRACNLPIEWVSWVLDLMERNMKEMYQRSMWGWDPDAKREELLHSSAWYLVATREGRPIAFSHFRFDIDYGIEVLYCYEIQLEMSSRRNGLGCFFMRALESIAFENKMQKVIMTVFKFNPVAISFFSSLGYRLDSTNPHGTERVDYVILSKSNLSLVTSKIE